MDFLTLNEGSLVSTLLSPVKTDVTSAIGEALPIAGTIFAAIAGVMFGFKLFKKISGART